MASWRDRARPADVAAQAPQASSWRSRARSAPADVAAEDQKLLASMGTTERFVAGLGSGALNLARNVQDVAGPGLDASGISSLFGGSAKPDRAQWKEEEAAGDLLSTTTAGMVGNVAGEVLPTIPLGGGVAGIAKSVLPRALPRAAAALLPMAAEGMAQGALLGGPENRASGAGWGGALTTGFGALGKAGGALSRRFAGKAAAATEKATELGAKRAAQETAAARSAAGHDAQALYRTLEHLRELRKSATPEALAQLAELEARGVSAASIEAELFAKSAGKLGDDLNAFDASRRGFREAAGGEGARAAAGAQEAAKSSLGKDAWELFKSYGEPIIGAAAGSALLGPVGGAGGMLGGLLLGRTRAGKAIRNRLAKPGNQLLLAKAGQKAASGVESLFGSSPAAHAPTPLSVRSFLSDSPSLSPAFAEGDAEDPEMLAQLARAHALRRRQEMTP